MLEYVCYEITIDLFQEEESITQNKDVHTLPIAFSNRVCLNLQGAQATINTGLKTKTEGNQHDS